MGKKRKASSGVTDPPAERGVDPKDAKLNINSFRDVADSEDEFHLNQDEILLGDGPDEKRRKQWREDDEILEASDQEVLGHSTDEDADDDFDHEVAPGLMKKGDLTRLDSEDPAIEEEDDGLGNWGRSKRDYYNADQIETEADAKAEEEEARRIQQKQLAAMNEADFLFDEQEWREPTATTLVDGQESEAAVITETLTELEITDDMTATERTNILKLRHPEFEPLAKEFVDLQAIHEELSEKYPTYAVTAQPAAETLMPIQTIKKQALDAYLGALSMYFALLTSAASTTNGATISNAFLRDHTVMDSLVRCRKLWKRVKDLPIPDIINDDIHLAHSTTDVMIESPSIPVTTTGVSSSMISKKPTKLTKAQLARQAAESAATARRLARIAATEAELASLSTLTTGTSRRAKPRTSTITATETAEPIALTAVEAAEKSRKRKDLRFYTSQITQKSSRRADAGKSAGGDADIPYRERIRDRQARLNAEAEARGKKSKPREDDARTALGNNDEDDDNDDDDRAAAAAIRNEADSEADHTGYYDLVAQRAATKKATKARAAAATKAPAERIIEPSTVDADGKRAIGYKIEKNKGLMPKRKKEVRNPRVKKRLKFAEKMKKLGSVRQVYKAGGEGRGGYGGEKTGIKGGVVRSIKL